MDSVSIMQPYIFPYIGYFQLIEATSKIVFYDDVNFIKKGWIHRNKILLNKTDFLFTIPVKKVSQNKLILETIPLNDEKFLRSFFAQIHSGYSKAPNYKEVKNLIEKILIQNYENMSDLAINSIIQVFQFLGKEINYTKSSLCSPDSRGIDKADRLIQIATNLGYKKYVNSSGGIALYDKDYFKSFGIDLYFIKPRLKIYKQFKNDFCPALSIIDVLMFNDKVTVKQMIGEYDLI